MNFLLIINFVCNIAFDIYYPFFVSKRFCLSRLNPITIVYFCAYPVIFMKKILSPMITLDEGLYNRYFGYAIFVENIEWIVCFIISGIFISLVKKYNFRRFFRFLPLSINMNPAKMRKVAIAFFVFFTFFFILLSSHSFGFFNWLVNPRDGYQYHRTGVGGYYALARLMFSTFIGIYFIYIRGNVKLLMSFFVVLPICYLFGSKGYLLQVAIYLFVILWFRKFRYFKMFCLMLIPVSFIIMLSLLNPSNIEDIVEYFDYYQNTSMFYEAYLKGELPLYNGKLFLTDFWSLVPRALYPDKPYVYGFLHVNEYFYPGLAERTHTPAFGGPIAYFADFGIIGVVLASIFNIKLFIQLFSYKLIFSKDSYLSLVKDPLAVALLILQFAPSYLDFFVFPLNVILFLFVLLFMSIFSRLKCDYSV